MLFRSQDLKSIFESSQSELLQLSGICKDAELYPEENPGEAVVRRSQILDSALYCGGYRPIFAQYSRDEQLALGNRLMNHLSILANPEDSELGLRKVVGMIEAGRSLAELGLESDWALRLEAPLNQSSARLYDVVGRGGPLRVAHEVE